VLRAARGELGRGERERGVEVVRADELDEAEEVQVKEEGRVGVEDLCVSGWAWKRVRDDKDVRVPLISGLCKSVASAWPRMSGLSVVHDLYNPRGRRVFRDEKPRSPLGPAR
jgi:hypothetical protein